MAAGFTGFPVVDAVDVAENDEGFGSHHGGNHAREFIVVGEHQFGYRHRVVFVDNGYHTVFEHHLHAVFLVEIVAACGKTLFHGEHLAAGNAVFAEEFVVAVDEFGLAHSRKELSGRYGVEFPVVLDTQLAAARGHGSRGDENDFDVVAAQLGHLVYQCRDAGNVEGAVGTGKYVTADFYRDAFVGGHAVED